MSDLALVIGHVGAVDGAAELVRRQGALVGRRALDEHPDIVVGQCRAGGGHGRFAEPEGCKLPLPWPVRLNDCLNRNLWINDTP